MSITPRVPVQVPAVAILGEGQSHCNTPAGRAIPHAVAQALGLPPPFLPAVGGASWTTLASTLTTRCFPFVRACRRPIVLLIGGTQDCIEGDTGAAIYAEMADHAVRIRRNMPTDGLIIGCTIPAVDGDNPLTGGAWTAPREAERVAANLLIVADGSGRFDAVADIASVLTDPTLVWPNDGALYDIDGTHLAQAGVDAATVVVLEAIDEADPGLVAELQAAAA